VTATVLGIVQGSKKEGKSDNTDKACGPHSGHLIQLRLYPRNAPMEWILTGCEKRQTVRLHLNARPTIDVIGIRSPFHTGWDVLHRLYENPILQCAPISSLGCASCDPVIAFWYLADAPSVYDRFR
jgi:uncharacterized protein DUF6010